MGLGGVGTGFEAFWARNSCSNLNFDSEWLNESVLNWGGFSSIGAWFILIMGVGSSSILSI